MRNEGDRKMKEEPEERGAPRHTRQTPAMSDYTLVLDLTAAYSIQ